MITLGGQAWSGWPVCYLCGVCLKPSLLCNQNVVHYGQVELITEFCGCAEESIYRSQMYEKVNKLAGFTCYVDYTPSTTITVPVSRK